MTGQGHCSIPQSFALLWFSKKSTYIATLSLEQLCKQSSLCQFSILSVLYNCLPVLCMCGHNLSNAATIILSYSIIINRHKIKMLTVKVWHIEDSQWDVGLKDIFKVTQSIIMSISIMHYAVVKSRPWMPYGMERSEINSGSIQIGCMVKWQDRLIFMWIMLRSPLYSSFEFIARCINNWLHNICSGVDTRYYIDVWHFMRPDRMSGTWLQ